MDGIYRVNTGIYRLLAETANPDYLEAYFLMLSKITGFAIVISPS